jgi:CRP-like cAMP-binding protein
MVNAHGGQGGEGTEGLGEGLRSRRMEEALGRVPLFRDLSPLERTRLAKGAVIRLCGEGKMVFREGDPGRCLYLVLDGMVKMFTYDHRGDRILLAAMGADQSFGTTGLLTGSPRTASVIAAEDSLLAEFAVAVVEETMREHPEIRKTLEELSFSRLHVSRDAKASVGADDRRAHPRLNIQLAVRFTVLPGAAGLKEGVAGQRFDALTGDISLGGVRLRVKEPWALDLPEDTQLRLEVKIEGGSAPLRASGRIRNRRPGGAEGWVLYGIAFEEMPTTETARLKLLIYGSGPT